MWGAFGLLKGDFLFSRFEKKKGGGDSKNGNDD